MTAWHSQEWLCPRLLHHEPELYDFRDAFAARARSALLQIATKVTAEERATARFFGLVRSIFYAMA